MEITLKLAGTKPLVLGSIEAANPRSAYYQAMQKLREGKRAKDRTPAWYDEMERLQFLAAFYTIPEISGIAIPQGNVRQSLIEAAKSKRLGPKAQGAVAVALDPAAPLIYEGCENHWTPEELFKHKEFVWTRMLRAKTGAGLATYPRFYPWTLTVQLELDVEVLSEDQFWELADLAGRITGIGACRKLGYGRFAVSKPKKNGGAS